MRNILASTAIAMVMASGATGAFAAAHTNMFLQESAVGDMRASEFIGMRLYVAEIGSDDVKTLRVRDDKLMSGDTEREWDDVGEINDVLLTHDGKVTGVLIDVGGFLGIGEKTVAVGMDQIDFVYENDEGEGEYFLVINSTEETLKNAPEFKTALLDGDIMDNETAEGDMTGQVATTDTAMADTRKFPPSDFVVTGYNAVDFHQLTAKDLDGARVYGVNNEDVGEISELLLTQDGKIQKAVIDVGGFLGIGEKSVAVSFDDLSVQKEVDGSTVRIYIDATEDSLKNLPEHDS